MSAIAIADAADEGSAPVEESVYPLGIYPWYVVAVLLIVTTLSYLDRQGIMCFRTVRCFTSRYSRLEPRSGSRLSCA